ncbi:MAG: DUF1795 domain-containing protein [Deltaproteobacteria bacterium]|nr:DUF1795 domain-containing protein [Deltaproteobacteria bacterium]
MTTFGSLSFDVPEGFSDQSQVVLLGPVKGGFQENLFITKDTDAKEQDLESYVDEQIASFHVDTEGYQLIERDERVVGGSPALSLEHRFDSEGVSIAQLQVYVKKEDGIEVFAFTHHADHFSIAKKRAGAFLKSVSFV